jgi:hypothetical protein
MNKRLCPVSFVIMAFLSFSAQGQEALTNEEITKLRNLLNVISFDGSGNPTIKADKIYIEATTYMGLKTTNGSMWIKTDGDHGHLMIQAYGTNSELRIQKTTTSTGGSLNISTEGSTITINAENTNGGGMEHSGLAAAASTLMLAVMSRVRPFRNSQVEEG